jgi:hypothetical protein
LCALADRTAFRAKKVKRSKIICFLYTKTAGQIVILAIERFVREAKQESQQMMVEDEVLKWKFKCGSRDALRRIYEKYLNRLLTLAMALLNDAGAAEDVVHDVFVSFAESAGDFKLA